MADCSEKTYRNAESHKLTKVNTGTSPYPPRKPGGARRMDTRYIH